jgi:hypothetical protein
MIILKGSSILDLRNTYFRTAMAAVGMVRVDEHFIINIYRYIGEYNQATYLFSKDPIKFTIKKLK